MTQYCSESLYNYHFHVFLFLITAADGHFEIKRTPLADHSD